MSIDTPVPETEWGLIFGDGVHCLRSALDHTVYAVAVKESGTDPPPAWRESHVPDHRGRLQVEGTGKADQDPWRAGAGSPQDPATPREPGRILPQAARGLQEFDNADKHRAVRAVATIPVHSLDNISGLVPGAQYSPDYRIAPLKDGTPWMTLTCAVPTPDVKVRSNLTLDVGIPWVAGMVWRPRC